jgi:hypothetical protein
VLALYTNVSIPVVAEMAQILHFALPENASDVDENERRDD